MQVVSLKKQIIRAGIFIIALILLGTTKSSAILQANATTHKSPATKNGATWLTEIRQMETANQTMGLSETLNGLNATKENGIDVHMMLPTEYGAVAILSASGYGNPKKLRDETDAQKRTTTGNSTGVYFTGDKWELTASNDNSKYMNKNNDAVGSILAFAGSRGWHGGNYNFSSTFYIRDRMEHTVFATLECNMDLCKEVLCVVVLGCSLVEYMVGQVQRLV